MLAAEWVNEVVGSGEAEREDAIEEGEVRACSGVARAAQGFSRFLIVCTFR